MGRAATSLTCEAELIRIESAMESRSARIVANAAVFGLFSQDMACMGQDREFYYTRRYGLGVSTLKASLVCWTLFASGWPGSLKNGLDFSVALIPAAF